MANVDVEFLKEILEDIPKLLDAYLTKRKNSELVLRMIRKDFPQLFNENNLDFIFNYLNNKNFNYQELTKSNLKTILTENI